MMARKTKKRKKPRQSKPDEVFSTGPLTIARFGSNVIWKSNWPKGAFDEVQKHQVECYPKTVEDIDTLVADIASLVSTLRFQTAKDPM
jgi:predicted TIM-barrel fold metal-dependent hydrolase